MINAVKFVRPIQCNLCDLVVLLIDNREVHGCYSNQADLVGESDTADSFPGDNHLLNLGGAVADLESQDIA